MTVHRTISLPCAPVYDTIYMYTYKIMSHPRKSTGVNDPVDQEYKMEKEINIRTRMLSIKPDTVKESSTKSL